jgi:hypothetical protein
MVSYRDSIDVLDDLDFVLIPCFTMTLLSLSIHFPFFYTDIPDSEKLLPSNRLGS